jgi:hypothetical protein
VAAQKKTGHNWLFEGLKMCFFDPEMATLWATVSDRMHWNAPKKIAYEVYGNYVEGFKKGVDKIWSISAMPSAVCKKESLRSRYPKTCECWRLGVSKSLTHNGGGGGS